MSSVRTLIEVVVNDIGCSGVVGDRIVELMEDVNRCIEQIADIEWMLETTLLDRTHADCKKLIAMRVQLLRQMRMNVMYLEVNGVGEMIPVAALEMLEASVVETKWALQA